jgi:4-amino-4-deoxy-L-arabinose transferase-like glycosyltransferase
VKPEQNATDKTANRWFVVSLLLVSCLAVFAALYVEPGRAGGTWDSVVYVGTARSLARGLGFYMAHSLPPAPLTNWPPLYPIVLAVPAYFSIDPAESARWINAFCWGCSVFLAGFIGGACCGRSYGIGILAALSILLSPDILEVHSQVLSEPLFIALVLACIAGLWMYVENRKIRYLIFTAFAISAALVTRYAGIFLLLGAGAILALNRRRFKPGKILRRNAGLAFAIAILPSIAWSVHNLFSNGRPLGGRRFIVHWLGLQRLRDLFRTVTLWFAPPAVPPSLRFLILALLLAVGFGTLLAARKSQRQSRDMTFRMTLLLAEICVVFDLLYLLLLFVTISFFDASTTLELRLLVPIFPVTVLLSASCLALRREMFGRQSVGYRTLLIVALLILLSNAARFSARYRDIRANGVGFQTEQWRDEEIVNYVRSLPEDTALYSDNPALVYDATQRAPYPVPLRFDIQTTCANPQFEKEMKALADLGNRRNVIVILFETNWLNGPAPPLAELTGKWGFVTTLRSMKGNYVLSAGEKHLSRTN